MNHYDRVIMSRPSHHLIPKHVVQQIIIENGTAYGVEFVNRNGSQFITITAKKEVILAAGAPHSPQILQLSGVGPKDLVENYGIESKIDLPGVGQNFQDHPTIFSVFNCKSSTSFTLSTSSANQFLKRILYGSILSKTQSLIPPSEHTSHHPTNSKR